MRRFNVKTSNPSRTEILKNCLTRVANLNPYGIGAMSNDCPTKRRFLALWKARNRRVRVELKRKREAKAAEARFRSYFNI